MLKELNICKSYLINEIYIIPLLQYCRQLTQLIIPKTTISETTWNNLDQKLRKRIVRN